MAEVFDPLALYLPANPFYASPTQDEVLGGDDAKVGDRSESVRVTIVRAPGTSEKGPAR